MTAEPLSDDSQSVLDETTRELFARDFAQIVHDMTLGQVESLVQAMLAAGAEMVENDNTVPMRNLVSSLALDLALVRNSDFRRALKDVQQQDAESAPDPIDREALFATLRP